MRKGQLLAQLENVQSSADVAATQAGLEAARTDALAAEAGYKTSLADLNRAKADHEQQKQQKNEFKLMIAARLHGKIIVQSL